MRRSPIQVTVLCSCLETPKGSPLWYRYFCCRQGFSWILSNPRQQLLCKLVVWISIPGYHCMDKTASSSKLHGTAALNDGDVRGVPAVCRHCRGHAEWLRGRGPLRDQIFGLHWKKWFSYFKFFKLKTLNFFNWKKVMHVYCFKF